MWKNIRLSTRQMLAFVTCLAATAGNGLAQTCTASAVMEKQRNPWTDESLLVRFNVEAKGATGMRRLVDVRIPADVRTHTDTSVETISVVVPAGGSTSGADFGTGFKNGHRGRVKLPVRLPATCRVVKSGPCDDESGGGAVGGSGPEALLGRWVLFSGIYHIGITVNGRIVNRTGTDPDWLMLRHAAAGGIEMLLAVSDDEFFAGRRLQDATKYRIERANCTTAGGTFECGEYALRATDQPGEISFRTKYGRVCIGARRNLDDSAFVEGLERRAASFYGQESWRKALALFTGTVAGSLAVDFPPDRLGDGLADLRIGGRQVRTTRAEIVGDNGPLDKAYEQIRIYVDDPVLGRGVVWGVRGDVAALDFTPSQGKVQHWFAASVDDGAGAPYYREFRARAFQQAVAAYREDNGLPALSAVETASVTPEPTPEPVRRRKSGWESMSELAGAVAAGLNQAQLDETIRLRQAAEQQAEAARQNDAAQRQVAAERQSEYNRQQADAMRQAGAARQQSVERQAEIARQQAAARQAESARQQAAQQQAETARQQPAQTVSDAEKRAPLSCFAYGSKQEEIAENRCPYSIDVTYCNQTPTGLGTAFRCDAQSFGNFGIGANGQQTTGLYSSHRPHMIVCRAPYSASNHDMRWDGSHLAGTCR